MPAQPDLTQTEQDKLRFGTDFDFREVARRPFTEISPNEIGMYKWWGIYHQLQKGFFMIRVRIPGGLLTADQLERAAELSEQYGQGELCITTRQTLQFHWIRKDDLYRILEGMQEVGLMTKNACGDVTRNVVSCPLQGVCPGELDGTTEMVAALADDPEIRDQQRNLPRKHKISVAGCGRACGQTLLNCQGWYPARCDPENDTSEIGWKLHAGGGLGARPYLAKVIFDWVPTDLVLPVAQATTEGFRRWGDRRKRAFARLKIVVDRMGAEGFREGILEIMRERGVEGPDRLVPGTNPPAVGDSFLNGQTVIPQKQPGYNVVRIMILRSELKTADARRIAGWAREYGNGQLMLTNRQNVELRFVPGDKVEPLLAEVREAGYPTDGFERFPDMVACVGSTLCNPSVSDTPNMYWRLWHDVANDREFWQQVGPLRINLTGCPNSCAQHWVADIGLRGARLRRDAGSQEGFAIHVGGDLSGQGHIGEFVAQVGADQAVAVIRRLLTHYVTNRVGSEETFGQFARRLGGKRLTQLLGSVPTAETPDNVRNLLMHPVFDQVLSEARAHEPRP